MSGRRVLGALGLIILLTAVLPPAAAVAVNRARVGAASREAAAIAAALERPGEELRNAARGALDADVLCGPGRMPLAGIPAAEPWVTTPRAALAVVVGNRQTLAPDPWGNCYVVNLAAILSAEPAVPWVLSAGPNGIIETPFVGRSETPGGDDVGTRIP